MISFLIGLGLIVASIMSIGLAKALADWGVKRYLINSNKVTDIPIDSLIVTGLCFVDAAISILSIVMFFSGIDYIVAAF